MGLHEELYFIMVLAKKKRAILSYEVNLCIMLRVWGELDGWGPSVEFAKSLIFIFISVITSTGIDMCTTCTYTIKLCRVCME